LEAVIREDTDTGRSVVFSLAVVALRERRVQWLV